MEIAVVLTASDERQAIAFRHELDDREDLESKGVVCALAVSDPGGTRIGSGGGTLNALAAVRKEIGLDRLGKALVVVIHSGGDSRRSPTQSVCGKAFTKLPSSQLAAPFDILLDQLLTVASGRPGLIVSCSDVLLVLPNTLQFSKKYAQGAVGIAILANAERYAPHHGVYLLDKDTTVHAFLQKPSFRELSAIDFPEAIDQDGNCLIDSGIIYFDAPTTRILAHLVTTDNTIGLVVNDPECTTKKIGRPPRIELYSDILRAFEGGGFSIFQEYLDMAADDPDPATVSLFRNALWKALHGIRLSAVCPSKADFKHLGTSYEFLQLCTEENDTSHFRTIFDLKRCVHSHNPASFSCVSVNSQLAGLASDSIISAQSLLEHSVLTGHCCIGPRCIVSAIRNCSNLHLPEGIVLQQLELMNNAGFVCLVLGIDDDVKACYPLGGYLNKGWPDSKTEHLWPRHCPTDKRSLWTARLFVPRPTAEDSISEALELIARGPLPKDTALSLQDVILSADNHAEFQWRRQLEHTEDCRRILSRDYEFSDNRLRRIAARCSQPELSKLCSKIQCEPQLQERMTKLIALSRQVHVARLCSRIERSVRRGEPAYIHLDENCVDAITTRLEDLCLKAMTDNDLILAARAAAVIADFCFRRDQLSTHEDVVLLDDNAPEASVSVLLKTWRQKPSSCGQQQYEALSAALVRLAVARSFSATVTKVQIVAGADTVRVRSTAPARIDLGGGWSDTPPIAYELNDAAVTNAAIRIDGKRPIGCDAILEKGQGEVILRVASVHDNDSDTIVLRTVADLADCRSPKATAALLKCCLKLRLGVQDDEATASLLPHAGCRLEIRSWSTLPLGSGLGTSSILAACILTALEAVFNGGCLKTDDIDRKRLVDEVLLVEQDLTTGGGFQDNVGGIFPGIKICSAAPSLPLRITITPLSSSPDLANHLLLIYTGAVRLAKNLLMNVVRRWHARSPEVVAAFQTLPNNARDAASACASASVETIGKELDSYWNLKKQVTGGDSVEPMRVREIIDALRPLIYGASLCGAGGGGFLLVVTKEPNSVEICKEALQPLFSSSNGVLSNDGGSAVYISTVEFDHTGIDVTTLHSSDHDEWAPAS